MTGNRDPELYWRVDNAEAAFAELRERDDVSLPLKQMPLGKVLGIKNPDGRPCNVLELARDCPSETVAVRARRRLNAMVATGVPFHTHEPGPLHE